MKQCNFIYNGKKYTRLEIERLINNGSITYGNQNEAFDYLEKEFGINRKDVKIVNGFINKVGFGQFNKNGQILLSSLMEEGTVFHEAFHLIFNGYLTSSEKKEFLDYIKNNDFYKPSIKALSKLYKDRNLSEDRIIEEVLAEEYRTYKLNQQNSASINDAKVKSIFDKIIDFLNKFFNLSKNYKEETLTDLFDKLSKKNFKEKVEIKLENDLYSKVKKEESLNSEEHEGSVIESKEEEDKKSEEIYNQIKTLKKLNFSNLQFDDFVINTNSFDSNNSSKAGQNIVELSKKTDKTNDDVLKFNKSVFFYSVSKAVSSLKNQDPKDPLFKKLKKDINLISYTQEFAQSIVRSIVKDLLNNENILSIVSNKAMLSEYIQNAVEKSIQDEKISFDNNKDVTKNRFNINAFLGWVHVFSSNSKNNKYPPQFTKVIEESLSELGVNYKFYKSDEELEEDVNDDTIENEKVSDVTEESTNENTSVSKDINTKAGEEIDFTKNIPAVIKMLYAYGFDVDNSPTSKSILTTSEYGFNKLTDFKRNKNVLSNLMANIPSEMWIETLNQAIIDINKNTKNNESGYNKTVLKTNPGLKSFYTFLNNYFQIQTRAESIKNDKPDNSIQEFKTPILKALIKSTDLHRHQFQSYNIRDTAIDMGENGTVSFKHTVPYRMDPMRANSDTEFKHHLNEILKQSVKDLQAEAFKRLENTFLVRNKLESISKLTVEQRKQFDTFVSENQDFLNKDLYTFYHLERVKSDVKKYLYQKGMQPNQRLQVTNDKKTIDHLHSSLDSIDNVRLLDRVSKGVGENADDMFGRIQSNARTYADMQAFLFADDAVIIDKSSPEAINDFDKADKLGLVSLQVKLEKARSKNRILSQDSGLLNRKMDKKEFEYLVLGSKSKDIQYVEFNKNVQDQLRTGKDVDVSELKAAFKLSSYTVYPIYQAMRNKVKTFYDQYEGLNHMVKDISDNKKLYRLSQHTYMTKMFTYLKYVSDNGLNKELIKSLVVKLLINRGYAINTQKANQIINGLYDSNKHEALMAEFGNIKELVKIFNLKSVYEGDLYNSLTVANAAKRNVVDHGSFEPLALIAIHLKFPNITAETYKFSSIIQTITRPSKFNKASLNLTNVRGLQIGAEDAKSISDLDELAILEIRLSASLNNTYIDFQQGDRTLLAGFEINRNERAVYSLENYGLDRSHNFNKTIIRRTGSLFVGSFIKENKDKADKEINMLNKKFDMIFKMMIDKSSDIATRHKNLSNKIKDGELLKIFGKDNETHKKELDAALAQLKTDLANNMYYVPKGTTSLDTLQKGLPKDIPNEPIFNLIDLLVWKSIKLYMNDGVFTMDDIKVFVDETGFVRISNSKYVPVKGFTKPRSKNINFEALYKAELNNANWLMEQSLMLVGDIAGYKSFGDLFKRLNQYSTTGNFLQNDPEIVAQTEELFKDGSETLFGEYIHRSPSNYVREVVAPKMEFETSHFKDINKTFKEGFKDMYQDSFSEKEINDFADEMSNIYNTIQIDDGATHMFIGEWFKMAIRQGIDKNSLIPMMKFESYIWNLIKKFRLENYPKERKLKPSEVKKRTAKLRAIIAEEGQAKLMSLYHEYISKYANQNNNLDNLMETSSFSFDDFYNKFFTQIELPHSIKIGFIGNLYLSNPEIKSDVVDSEVGISKTAGSPMVPSMMVEFWHTDIVPLNMFMERSGTGMISSDGARKRGVKSALKTYDDEGNFILNENYDKDTFETNHNHYIPYDLIKIIVETDSFEKKAITDSTQMRAIILAQVTDKNGNVKPEYKKLVDEYIDLFEEFYNYKKDKFFKEHNLTDDEIKVINHYLTKSINNFSNKENPIENIEKDLISDAKFKEIIKNLISSILKSKQSDLSVNLIESINNFDGLNHIDLLLFNGVLETEILTTINKNLVDIKRRGKALTLSPDAYLTDGITRIKPLDANGQPIKDKNGNDVIINKTNTDISFYKLNGNKVVASDVVLPLPKEWIKPLSLLFNTNNMFEITNILNDLIDTDPNFLIELIGARIPNQQLSSTDVLKVRKFMYPTMSNMAITSNELVAKVGMDFDFDKMYSYMESLAKVLNGSVNNITVAKKLLSVPSFANVNKALEPYINNTDKINEKTRALLNTISILEKYLNEGKNNKIKASLESLPKGRQEKVKEYLRNFDNNFSDIKNKLNKPNLNVNQYVEILAIINSIFLNDIDGITKNTTVKTFEYNGKVLDFSKNTTFKNKQFISEITKSLTNATEFLRIFDSGDMISDRLLDVQKRLLLARPHQLLAPVADSVFKDKDNGVIPMIDNFYNENYSKLDNQRNKNLVKYFSGIPGLIDSMEKALQKIDLYKDSPVFGLFSSAAQAIKKTETVDTKKGVGIVALYLKNHTQTMLQRGYINVSKAEQAKQETFVLGRQNFLGFDRNVMGGFMLNSISSTNRLHDIMVTLSAILTTQVDGTKDAYATAYQLLYSQLGVYTTMVRLGMDPQAAWLFLNHPAVIHANNVMTKNQKIIGKKYFSGRKMDDVKKELLQGGVPSTVNPPTNIKEMMDMLKPEEVGKSYRMIMTLYFDLLDISRIASSGVNISNPDTDKSYRIENLKSDEHQGNIMYGDSSMPKLNSVTTSDAYFLKNKISNNRLFKTIDGSIDLSGYNQSTVQTIKSLISANKSLPILYNFASIRKRYDEYMNLETRHLLYERLDKNLFGSDVSNEVATLASYFNLNEDVAYNRTNINVAQLTTKAKLSPLDISNLSNIIAGLHFNGRVNGVTKDLDLYYDLLFYSIHHGGYQSGTYSFTELFKQEVKILKDNKILNANSFLFETQLLLKESFTVAGNINKSEYINMITKAIQIFMHSKAPYKDIKLVNKMNGLEPAINIFKTRNKQTGSYNIHILKHGTGYNIAPKYILYTAEQMEEVTSSYMMNLQGILEKFMPEYTLGFENGKFKVSLTSLMQNKELNGDKKNLQEVTQREIADKINNSDSQKYQKWLQCL